MASLILFPSSLALRAGLPFPTSSMIGPSDWQNSPRCFKSTARFSLLRLVLCRLVIWVLRTRLLHRVLQVAGHLMCSPLVMVAITNETPSKLRGASAKASAIQTASAIGPGDARGAKPLLLLRPGLSCLLSPSHRVLSPSCRDAPRFAPPVEASRK